MLPGRALSLVSAAQQRLTGRKAPPFRRWAKRKRFSAPSGRVGTARGLRCSRPVSSGGSVEEAGRALDMSGAERRRAAGRRAAVSGRHAPCPTGLCGLRAAARRSPGPGPGSGAAGSLLRFEGGELGLLRLRNKGVGGGGRGRNSDLHGDPERKYWKSMLLLVISALSVQGREGAQMWLSRLKSCR